MANLPQIFSFGEKSLNAFLDENGEPWFYASDVCALLEVKNVAQAVARLDEDEKGIYSNDTLGGSQKVSIINESGLYSLTLSSKKKEAKDFKRWVTKDVIPAIRKNGKYEVVPVKELSPAEMLLQSVQLLVAQQKDIEVVKDRLDVLEAKQITHPQDYFTIAGYSSLIHRKIQLKEAAALGRKSTKLCIDMGYSMGSMVDPRFGTVKTYPKDVLEIIFNEN